LSERYPEDFAVGRTFGSGRRSTARASARPPRSGSATIPNYSYLTKAAPSLRAIRGNHGEFMRNIYYWIADHLVRLGYARKVKRGRGLIGGLVMGERPWIMPAAAFVAGIVIFVAMVTVLRYLGAV